MIFMCMTFGEECIRYLYLLLTTQVELIANESNCIFSNILKDWETEFPDHVTGRGLSGKELFFYQKIIENHCTK